MAHFEARYFNLTVERMKTRFKFQGPSTILPKWQMNKEWQEKTAEKYVFGGFKLVLRD